MFNDDFVIVDFTGKTLTEEDIKQCIEELRKLVLVQTVDAYLLRFLHCTDFNVPKAVKRMHVFHDLVQNNPEWFIPTSPLDKKHKIEENSKVMLRERDKDGRSIYLVKMGKVDANTTSAKEQAQIDQMWFESVLEDPETQATGISVIIDMSGYSWKLFRWITPTVLKMTGKTAEIYPCKEFVYHIVNTSFWVNATAKLFWPFLSQDIKKQIKFHFENWPSLHEHISPDVLPKEYGGTGSDIDFEKLNQWLYDQDSKIGERMKYQQIPQK